MQIGDSIPEYIREPVRPLTPPEWEAVKEILNKLNTKSEPIIQGTRLDARALAAPSGDYSVFNTENIKPQGRLTTEQWGQLQRLIGQLPSMGGSDEPELAPELAQALAARPEDSGLSEKIITLPQENIIEKKPVLAGEQWEELREWLMQQGNKKVDGIQPELARALTAPREDLGLLEKKSLKTL